MISAWRTMAKQRMISAWWTRAKWRIISALQTMAKVRFSLGITKPYWNSTSQRADRTPGPILLWATLFDPFGEGGLKRALTCIVTCNEWNHKQIYYDDWKFASGQFGYKSKSKLCINVTSEIIGCILHAFFMQCVCGCTHLGSLVHDCLNSEDWGFSLWV